MLVTIQFDRKDEQKMKEIMLSTQRDYRVYYCGDIVSISEIHGERCDCCGERISPYESQKHSEVWILFALRTEADTMALLGTLIQTGLIKVRSTTSACDFFQQTRVACDMCEFQYLDTPLPVIKNNESTSSKEQAYTPVNKPRDAFEELFAKRAIHKCILPPVVPINSLNVESKPSTHPEIMEVPKTQLLPKREKDDKTPSSPKISDAITPNGSFLPTAPIKKPIVKNEFEESGNVKSDENNKDTCTQEAHSSTSSKPSASTAVSKEVKNENRKATKTSVSLVPMSSCNLLKVKSDIAGTRTEDMQLTNKSLDGPVKTSPNVIERLNIKRELKGTMNSVSDIKPSTAYSPTVIVPTQVLSILSPAEDEILAASLKKAIKSTLQENKTPEHQGYRKRLRTRVQEALTSAVSPIDCEEDVICLTDISNKKRHK